MARVNVYHDGKLGWFDPAKAERFTEATWWNGSVHISKATGSQWDSQAVYRTKGGRWVLRCWSRRQGEGESYRFISDEEAKKWLLENEEDEAVQRYFGEIEEERGPGRPAVGPVLNVRLTEEQRDKLKALADGGESLAAVVRRLVDQA